MENKDKGKVLIILILTATLLFVIVQNGRIRSLEAKISSLENNLISTFRNEFSNYANYFESTLERSQSLIDTYSFSYDGINPVRKTVNVIFQFKLKETTQNTNIQVAALDSNSSEVVASFYAEPGSPLEYAGNFTLSYLRDYIFEVYEVGENGYTKKLNTNDFIGLYVKNEMENRTTLTSFGSSVGQEDITIDFDVANRTFGEEDFRLDKLEFIVSRDGKELYKKDVTNYSLANSEEIALHKVSVAAGEQHEDIDYEYQKATMDPDGVERGYYVLGSISHDEILGERTGSEVPVYSFSVKITFKNGETKTLRQN